MPILEELAIEYKGRPVAFIGMNDGDTEKDVKAVIDKLRYPIRTLQAHSTVERYHIIGFPTVFVIDKQGILKEVCGDSYSTLAASLRKMIDSLLISDGSDQ